MVQIHQPDLLSFVNHSLSSLLEPYEWLLKIYLKNTLRKLKSCQITNYFEEFLTLSMNNSPENDKYTEDEEIGIFKAFSYIINALNFLLGAVIAVRWIYPFLNSWVGVGDGTLTVSNFVYCAVLSFVSFEVGQLIMTGISLTILCILGFLWAFHDFFGGNGGSDDEGDDDNLF